MKHFISRIDVLLFTLTAVFFLLFPNLDLHVSAWFYQAETGFYLSEVFWVRAFYLVFADISLYILALMLILWIAGFLIKQLSTAQKPLAFLIVSLVLGPGILVNSVVKTYSGRARPEQIETFGANKHYSAPLHLANQCPKNCSFVSGHASAAFWFMAFAWVFRRKCLLFAGLLLGSITGLGRIIQGGHFMSDVIFAGWLTYFSLVLIAHWFYPSTSEWFKLKKQG